MRPLHELDEYRDRQWEALCQAIGTDYGGCFRVRSCTDGNDLRCIVSSGIISMGWDHVSVSRKTRCPNWPEMEQVKRLFFYDHECAMQLHVPVEDHRNFHQYCLHIWRPIHIEIPRPPAIMVAPAQLKPETTT